MTTANRASSQPQVPFWHIHVSIGQQVARFAVVGIVSTIAYAALYPLLRTALPATAANAVGLLVTAIGNTAANRRLTFGVRGRHGLVHDHAGGLTAFAIALLITTRAVSALDRVLPAAGATAELAVLTGANGIATVVRFALLRSWLAGRRSIPGPASPIEQNIERNPA